MDIVRTVGTSGSSEAPSYVLRMGIDWESMETMGPAVRPFMVWVLYHSKKIPDQWQYPYPKEIDAMYESQTKWKSDEETQFDAHEVYSKIDVKRQLARDVSNIPAHITATGSALLPTLRDYQKAAVSWMLARESVDSAQNLQDHEQPSDGKVYLGLSRCVRFPWPKEAQAVPTTVTAAGKELLYDIFSEHFRVADGAGGGEPKVSDIDAVRGGILADEMGLGKTVEVIALVLANPSPQRLPVLLTQVEASENDDHESEDVRGCICGSEEDCDPGWVQCQLCCVWHHQLCTGFDPNSSLPFAISSDCRLQEGSFTCFHCQVKHDLVLSCKTTLIVSPESIHSQWESELKRHVRPGALTTMRYPGVKVLRSRLQGKGPSAEWRVLSTLGTQLASYDIVLTTYEALASDLHHIPTEVGRERRSSTRQKRKKYAFIASPLVFLKFWRVCMDEAQVGVENTQIQAALTVSELRTEMNWIVTGTPFSTQLMDLYGCFTFLRLAPYCDNAMGKRLFKNELEDLFARGATERVFDLLLWDGRKSRHGGGLLWRTNKRDVFAQLGLPKQSEELVWCSFSDVERLFYNNQEAEVIKALLQEKERRKQQMGSDYEDEEVGDNVWHRLLLLRQVCCHPQVGQIMRSIGASDRSTRRRGRGGRTSAGFELPSGDQVGLNVLTMDDFLVQLLERCRRECEEAQRKLIAAHNGHASIALIGDDFSTAIIKYMLSVQLIRTNWDDFRADLLPRLHILDNLAMSVRRAFDLDSEMDVGVDDDVDANFEATDADRLSRMAGISQNGNNSAFNAPEEDNPKMISLMPALPVLLRSITGDGLVVEGVDHEAIATECEKLQSSADKIRRFYLQEAEYKHSVALHQFATMRDAMESKLFQPNTRGRTITSAGNKAMLCSSSVWWIEMFDCLKQLPDSQANVMHMVHRLRAHLYALGTAWSTSFAERFHDIHGLGLVLTNELMTLHDKRNGVMKTLLSQSHRRPTKAEIESSGNCKKCRDARDGPICWHCKFYKELEGYKQHILGVDNTIVSASGLASWTADLLANDEEEVGEESMAMTTSSSTTASTSLILDVFRQLTSGTRLLLRDNHSLFSATEVQRLTKAFQDGLQQEVDVWAGLLREWNRARKLFQAQHQRLGSLDELEMAQMKIRLRFPGEIVETATDKLYKLEPHEIPVKSLAFDAEKVVAETELKQKQSELRYLKYLQDAKESKLAGTNATETEAVVNDRDSNKTCVVCLEDISKKRVAMLPSAHKTCVQCSEQLARQLRASRSIRCPTCRRIYSIDERKEVENDVERAKEAALVARTAVAHLAVADSDVALLKGGFSSKIDAILRRVRGLANKNQELKALVFTQWQDMMGVIAAALQLNGIKCFTYASKKQFPRVLHEFKMYPDPCVLVLPFKIGANGLNIIEATEVLLVEPLLNTSIEAQAINRVHRIGQTKTTRVHRFVVLDSVEEQIHWLGRATQQRQHAPIEAGEALSSEELEPDESVVVGRQEKEQVTLGQLQALLHGQTMVSSVNGQMDTSRPNGGVHPFWQQRVQMNGREMTRREARELLERRRAAERRANSTAPDTTQSEPVTSLVDRDVPLSVAHDLLQLSVSESDVHQSSGGLKELLLMAQQRVGEEMQLWRACRQNF